MFPARCPAPACNRLFSTDQPGTTPCPACGRAVAVHLDAHGQAATLLPPVTPVGRPGAVAAGRYELGEEIARGGMGAVYRVRDTNLDRDLAVKVMLADPAARPDLAARFAAEARLTAAVQHPGVVPVHEVGTLLDGRPFFAMKLVRGQTLAELLAARESPAADLPRLVDVFLAVCQAVGYAHSRGVMHRDLKPHNVMVGDFGEVQVMDWGLARPVHGAPGPAADDAPPAAGAATPAAGETRVGAAVGTPGYMAPEQARGEPLDPRADVFALGAVLFEILTGGGPFGSGPPDVLVFRAAEGMLAPAFEALDGCGADPELVAVCRRCLSPDPAGRPADGTAVAGLVSAYRAGVEERLRAAERERAAAEAKAAEQRKRKRVQLALAGLVVVLVTGAGAVAVWRVSENARREFDEARLAAEDRDRKARAEDAGIHLLDQAKTWLAAEDADRADPFVSEAAKRLAEAGVTTHADRLNAYRAALHHLRVLDGVKTFLWDTTDLAPPPPEKVVGKWREAFKEFGIVPGSTPPAEAAARVNESPIRTALLAALDGWLARSPSESVRAIMTEADPADPFRAEVRRLLAARDRAGLLAVAARHEWDASDRSGGLAVAYAASPLVPAEVTGPFLKRIVRTRQTDFDLVMQLGMGRPVDEGFDWKEQARWFQVAVALRPTNSAAHNGLGMCLGELKDPDGAIVAFNRAIALEPGSAKYHHNLANQYLAKKDLDRALASYREAIRLDGTLPRPHYGAGICLRRKGDVDAALPYYREAIRLDPEQHSFHDGLGFALQDKKSFVESARAFGEAVRLNPESAKYRINLGDAQSDANDLDGAESSYRTAIQIDPTNPTAHNNLGLVLRARHDYVRAESAFRAALRIDPRFKYAHCGLGDLFRLRGRLEEAIAAYRAALAIDPKYSCALTRLDYCLRVQRGEVPTAPPPRAISR